MDEVRAKAVASFAVRAGGPGPRSHVRGGSTMLGERLEVRSLNGGSRAVDGEALTTLDARLDGRVLDRGAPGFPESVHGAPVAGVVVCWTGPVDDGLEVVQPLREPAEPVADLVDVKPYTTHQKLLEDAPRHVDWARRFWEDMRPFGTGGTCGNFLNMDDGEERLRQA